jgi:ABC-type nitrate/sulfonate/bicarbonate transport system substrate-binding protein
MLSKLRSLLLAIILLMPLLGISLQSHADALKIAVSRTPLSLPFYIAEEKGFFAGEDVQVILNEAIGGNRAMQQILAGDADLATCSDVVVMFNSFKRNDYAIISTFVTSSDDVKLIVRNEAGIKSPEQIVGKRVGMIVGAASNYFFDMWLMFHGVDPKLVQVVSLQPETMGAALAKGEVDAVAVWEPFAYKILNSVPGAKILSEAGIYVETFNLIVSKKLIGIRDEDLVRLLRALDLAQRFISNEPQKAQAILRARLQTDQAFTDWIWPRLNFGMKLDQSLLSTLESEARWARHEGHIVEAHAPNYLEFIYAKPLLKVRPEAVGIVR